MMILFVILSSSSSCWMLIIRLYFQFHDMAKLAFRWSVVFFFCGSYICVCAFWLWRSYGLWFKADIFSFYLGWLNDQPANLGTTGLTPNFWQTHLIGDMCIQPMPMLKADLGCSYHLSISYYVGFLIFILCWFWSWNIIFI